MHRTRRHNHYDLYGDLEKIKSIFATTAFDARGKAGEILSQSINDVREKSAEIKENVADYTAEKPFKSLAIAVGVGVVLGYFFLRR